MPSSPLPSAYEPSRLASGPVVSPGEFVFGVAHLDHGHIFGQVDGLLTAGATLRWVYDPDPQRRADFCRRYAETGVREATDVETLLDDDEVRLVAAAAIPSDRGPLGCRVMQAGKDYFTDKCPFTTLEQLAEARRVAAATGRKFIVYYSERLHVESAIHADTLLRGGAIGEVVHLNIMGPHRLGQGRPAWFFEKARYGGILTDICSHQADQFLHYGRTDGGQVLHARVDNVHHPEWPEFEDFGEAVFRLNNGVSCHSRVDWFTPDGLGTWGDGRLFAVGTKGSLEIRKYLDVGRQAQGDHIYLVDQADEYLIDCAGKVGFPFFGHLVLDCLNRTENAMSQAHAFSAAELSLQAQAHADRERAARQGR